MKKIIIPILLLCSSCNNDKAAQERFQETQKNLGYTTTKAITQCFEAIYNKDTVLLNLDYIGNTVKGNLEYKRFEKDYANGVFSGVITGDTIKGSYNFMSEGVNSTTDKYFLIKGAELWEGTGNMDVRQDTAFFTDPQNLDYEKGYHFIKKECI